LIEWEKFMKKTLFYLTFVLVAATAVSASAAKKIRVVTTLRVAS